MSDFRLATRCARIKSSAIRQILKVTAAPDIISFAGGLPAPELFPLEDIGRAAEATLHEDGAAAMQYGPTEGYLPLREWVCAHLAATVKLQASPGIPARAGPGGEGIARSGRPGAGGNSQLRRGAAGFWILRGRAGRNTLGRKRHAGGRTPAHPGKLRTQAEVPLSHPQFSQSDGDQPVGRAPEGDRGPGRGARRARGRRRSL